MMSHLNTLATTLRVPYPLFFKYEISSVLINLIFLLFCVWTKIFLFCFLFSFFLICQSHYIFLPSFFFSLSFIISFRLSFFFFSFTFFTAFILSPLPKKKKKEKKNSYQVKQVLEKVVFPFKIIWFCSK